MNRAYTLIKSLNDLISSSGTVFTAEFFHSNCADDISYGLCSAASLAPHCRHTPHCPVIFAPLIIFVLLHPSLPCHLCALPHGKLFYSS